jgi:hypothetical protein
MIPTCRDPIAGTLLLPYRVSTTLHLQYLTGKKQAPPPLAIHSLSSIYIHPMRPFAPQVARFSNRSSAAYPSVQSAVGLFSTGYHSTPSPKPNANARMSSTNVGELKLENTDIKTAPGVDLSSEQRTLISSVLDLFAGRPSLAKLQLWKDDAVFSDPITVAKGRKEFEPQWVSQYPSAVQTKERNVL